MPFMGNDHLVYNSSFYYYNHFTESIVKYDLNSRYAVPGYI